MDRSLRDRLVDAGVDLVLSEGVGSVGLREIARRAGVSHGAPRRYFPTHHALLSAIARRGFADLGARFEVVTAGARSARERLAALGREYVGYALAHRGMFELMFRHDLLDSETHGGAAPLLRESTRPLFRQLVELVARHRADTGAPGDPPPEVTAAALWTNLHGIAQLWIWGSIQLALDPPAAPADTTTESLDRLVGAALAAHLGTEPGRRR